MTKISVILAQAAPATPAAPGGAAMLMQMAPLVLMFAAMYFLLIAPQRKKQKAHEKMMSELKAGDEIITSGGIHGVISSVRDDRYVVRIGDNNTKVEIAKGFVSALVKKTDAA
ncbi:preprotein translocase subunit YajC [Oleiharenicola lentus]|uniref:preprotein translocase subunit YajC n=1 Tax=Oleiharenicola lentus TaxID=2508720 RepID=UPI003F661718